MSTILLALKRKKTQGRDATNLVSYQKKERREERGKWCCLSYGVRVSHGQGGSFRGSLRGPKVQKEHTSILGDTRNPEKKGKGLRRMEDLVS